MSVAFAKQGNDDMRIESVIVGIYLLNFFFVCTISTLTLIVVLRNGKKGRATRLVFTSAFSSLLAGQFSHLEFMPHIGIEGHGRAIQDMGRAH